MRYRNEIFGIAGVFCFFAACAFGDAKVEQQEVGPAQNSDVIYVVSPHGAHLGTVAHKGSRMNVLIDGVAGPKLDEIYGVYNKVASSPTIIMPFTPTISVVFSDDGTHYAYIGRESKDWVLIADGKEVMRTPAVGYVAGQTGTVALNMAYTGNDGKHLMLAQSGLNGSRFWVDCQEVPPAWSEPIASNDGAHYVYLSMIDKNSVIVVDGKPTAYPCANAQKFQFTADGKHLVYLCSLAPAKGQAVMVDGKPLFQANQILDYYLSPVGYGIIAVLAHQDKNGNAAGWFLLAGGKPVEASLSPQPIDKVVISPDGKHFAAHCNSAANVQYVVADGKKGQEYVAIDKESMAFSPDSEKLGYIAESNGKSFIVVNEDESDAFNAGYPYTKFFFSPQGKHVLYCGQQKQSNTISLDGKPEITDSMLHPDSSKIFFSPDGSQHAYMGQQLYLNGKAANIFANTFKFSPDSKHFACVGVRGGPGGFSNTNALIIDDQSVFTGGAYIRHYDFTPDSQHVYWMVLEPSANPGVKPGQFVTYLDGKKVASFDFTPAFGAIVGIATGTFAQNPPAWDIDANGTLTALGPVGDVVQRIRITPSADTSIATLIADAQAADAKAAADAAAAKQPKPKTR